MVVNIMSFQLSQSDHLIYPILQILDLSQNRISTLPSLSHLHALRNLNLSENVIRDMDPSALASLSQLTTLDLSQNQLRKVSPSLFLDLSKLGYLTLAGNYIEQVIIIFLWT